MKNSNKVSYKEVLAQKNYDFMVSEGARFCDARDVKNLILDNYSPEEAILKVAEDMIFTDFEYNLECKYINGYLETVHYLQNFVKEEGLEILQKTLEKKGCSHYFFSRIVEGYQMDIEILNLHGPVEQAIKDLREFGGGQTKTHAVGGGEWSLEVYDADDQFLFEFVGSNGTRGPSSDLYHQFDVLCEIAFHCTEEQIEMYLNK